MVNRRGLLAGVAAYSLWGLFPLYWPLLEPSGPGEILAHRIAWTLVAVLVVLAIQNRCSQLLRLDRRRLGLLTLAAVVVSLNWLTFIYAVNSGQTVEAALGYFINPLINVALGVLIFRERLRPLQWTAVGLGTLAVVVLTTTYGRLPWIALVLAGSFATYGVLKKFAAMPSAESLTVETAVLLPPVLAFIIILHVNGTATFGQAGVGHALLLAGAGVITALPLMLFNAAATRIPLSVIGMLQYLAPTLQFLIGVVVFAEQMPTARWIGFALVWGALALLTADGLRAVRRRAVVPSAGGSSDSATR